MRRKRRKKDDLLFRVILGSSFVLFWSCLVVIGFVSRAIDRDARELVRTVNTQTFDPSSDPEGFSLYAEFSSSGRRGQYGTGGKTPDDGFWKQKTGDTPGATALSNNRESGRLVNDN